MQKPQEKIISKLLVTHVIRFIKLEENGTIADQLQKGGKDDKHSAIIINKFNVKPNDVCGLLKAWEADAAYLKQKQGFKYAQIHHGISCSCMFVNYAVLESEEYIITLPVILLLDRLSPIIHKALRSHHIYSEKLLCVEPV